MKLPLFSLVRILCILSAALGWQISRPSLTRQLRRDSLVAMQSVAPSLLTNNDPQRFTIQANEMPQMIPLSNPPLLLLQSSTPIISREECNILSRYFENEAASKDSTYAFSEDQERAKAILHRVTHTIDLVTNCRSHESERQIPRYVRYDAKASSLDQLMSRDFIDVLLPDGLHVDTNNGQLFRHITAILYLTDNQNEYVGDFKSEFMVGGGTTFPLAVPYGSQGTAPFTNSGANLLSRDIHHTKAANGDLQDPDQQHLEQTAVDVFYRDVRECFRASHHIIDNRRTEIGIRVTPQAGKLIYFHNIGNDGKPDPISFHGGEELINIGEETGAANFKSILVFFKEIPLEKITDIESFAEEVSNAREWTINNYYAL